MRWNKKAKKRQPSVLEAPSISLMGERKKEESNEKMAFRLLLSHEAAAHVRLSRRSTRRASRKDRQVSSSAR